MRLRIFPGVVSDFAGLCRTLGFRWLERPILLIIIFCFFPFVPLSPGRIPMPTMVPGFFALSLASQRTQRVL